MIKVQMLAASGLLTVKVEMARAFSLQPSTKKPWGRQPHKLPHVHNQLHNVGIHELL